MASCTSSSIGGTEGGLSEADGTEVRLAKIWTESLDCTRRAREVIQLEPHEREAKVAKAAEAK